MSKRNLKLVVAGLIALLPALLNTGCSHSAPPTVQNVAPPPVDPQEQAREQGMQMEMQKRIAASAAANSAAPKN